jgi:ribosome-associated protein
MIEVTNDIRLDESELEWHFVRGSGPGGQNVNKVASAVQLRWDAMGSPALTQAVKHRLARLAGQRLTDQGEILIEAGAHRSQRRNRREALERLLRLIRRAATPPKPRRPTRPPRSAKVRRMEDKRRHSAKKRHRRFDPQRDWG